MRTAIAWVTSTVIGLALGGYFVHFAGSFGGLADFDLLAIFFGGAMGFVTGIGVALIQWLALGLSRRQGLRLVLAMALSIGVTHGSQDGSPNWMSFAGVAAANSILVTVIVAGLFGVRSPLVLLACGVGWAGGQIAGNWLTFSILGMPWHDDYPTQHAVVGIVVALAWGIPTALTGLPAAIRAVGRAQA
jgi:hypothetical protein